MKNKKVIAFYVIAIAVIICIAILALIISGNSGAFYLCLGIIAGVIAIVLSKIIINKRSNKR